MSFRITAIASAILCLVGAASALTPINRSAFVAERDGVRVVMGVGNGAHIIRNIVTMNFASDEILLILALKIFAVSLFFGMGAN